MSEEERKGAIEIIRTLYGVHRSEDYQKAFNIAIAMLEAEPIKVIQADITEDLANATRESKQTQDDVDTGICIGLQMALDTVNKYIDKSELKTGHWTYDSYYGGYYICSECGHTQGSKSSECPQCHTKMEVKNE